jgi:hypothetical protein
MEVATDSVQENINCQGDRKCKTYALLTATVVLNQGTEEQTCDWIDFWVCCERVLHFAAEGHPADCLHNAVTQDPQLQKAP